jgi:toxin ParE1/3/4
MPKIYFTREALFDIEAIVIWYESKRKGLSYDFELCLEAGINEINRYPDLFKKNTSN